MPHLGHTNLLVVVVIAVRVQFEYSHSKTRKQAQQSLFAHYIHFIRFALTFAGLNAFKPPVLNILVAVCSALLVPSTAGSATTGSAGFLERAALWAHHLVNNR